MAALKSKTCLSLVRRRILRKLSGTAGYILVSIIYAVFCVSIGAFFIIRIKGEVII